MFDSVDGVDLSKCFATQPTRGMLYPGEKPQSVTTTFKSEQEITIRDQPMLKCQVYCVCMCVCVCVCVCACVCVCTRALVCVYIHSISYNQCTYIIYRSLNHILESQEMLLLTFQSGLVPELFIHCRLLTL